MPKFRNLLCFLSHVFLVYITSVSSDSGGPNDLVFNVTSCDVSGTIHATKDSHVASVFVECNHNEGDTLKAADISGGDDFTITGCPINKPVKILIFNETHEGTAGPVVKSHSLIKEAIVVCDGSKIAVDYNVSNSPFSPTAVTHIPLTNELRIKVTTIDNTPVTNVDIEHTYKLKITGPANMHILVESCDAASNSDFSEHNVSLYANR
ncbi:uncharacterized protein LOC117340791 [Pecten maximus]|uniref:uncharacterized protein LOC117340791 n=1 Tax=Pecten maximus TaxID=6579 RepID=UPI00145806F8|nr:uncharacterized protein LOC117340791 [Pecten maximus]